MDNSVIDDTSQAQVEIPAQVTEKMVAQSKVNEIVRDARRDAASKAVEEFKNQQARNTDYQYASQQPREPNYSRTMSEDDIKRVTGDEIKRHMTQMEQEAQERANADAANRIVGMFREKIEAGRGKFEDFETVAGNVALQYYPNVVQLLAEQVDNTADVLYHLAQNRDKLYRLESLSGHNPSDAIYEIKRLADSIKSNDEVSKMKNANSPLSQQRPSNTGTDSGSSLSMTDLKRKYRA